MSRVVEREASLELGRAIQRAREDAGLEQTELAARLGWSVRTLSKLETGVRPIYTRREIEAVAREVGVPPRSLVAGRPAPVAGLPVAGLVAGLTDEQLALLVREARAEQRARAAG